MPAFKCWRSRRLLKEELFLVGLIKYGCVNELTFDISFNGILAGKEVEKKWVGKGQARQGDAELSGSAKPIMSIFVWPSSKSVYSEWRKESESSEEEMGRAMWNTLNDRNLSAVPQASGFFEKRSDVAWPASGEHGKAWGWGECGRQREQLAAGFQCFCMASRAWARMGTVEKGGGGSARHHLSCWITVFAKFSSLKDPLGLSG